MYQKGAKCNLFRYNKNSVDALNFVFPTLPRGQTERYAKFYGLFLPSNHLNAYPIKNRDLIYQKKDLKKCINDFRLLDGVIGLAGHHTLQPLSSHCQLFNLHSTYS